MNSLDEQEIIKFYTQPASEPSAMCRSLRFMYFGISGSPAAAR